MKKTTLYLSTCLLLLSATAAAADKTLSLQSRNATLQCLDRTIELKADCNNIAGDRLQECTRQSLAVDAGASQLNLRTFSNVADQKVGALLCVATKNKEKYIVAQMFNGGNCEACEWADVYSWDGALLGSNRDRKKKIKAVDDALEAVYDQKTRRIIKQEDLPDFYAYRKPVKTSAASSFACPVKQAVVDIKDNPSYEQSMAVSNELDKRIEAALGPDARNPGEPGPFARLQKKLADPARMAAIAEVTGCAALLDRHSSCASFFEPEFGGPLFLFMEMKKSAPLRQQFDAAINDLANPQQKAAAQYCIKLVGKK